MPKIYQYSGSHLFLLFWKASHAAMRYDHESIASQGFASLSDYAVLEVLLHKGALPVNTIGEKVLLTSGSMTTAVQRLEKKGLVIRERSEGDARIDRGGNHCQHQCREDLHQLSQPRRPDGPRMPILRRTDGLRRAWNPRGADR